jgi:hypothetical protein
VTADGDVLNADRVAAILFLDQVKELPRIERLR